MRKEALAKLQGDDVHTLHKPIREHFRRHSYIATHITDLYQADLLDLSKYKRFHRGYRYVLTVIDSLSRYLYMVPLKSKCPQDVKKAFVRAFRHGTPKHLLIDRSTEFYGKTLREYMKKKRVNHYSTFSGMKASMAERVQRTILERLSRHFTSTGKNAYLKILPRIVADYNNSIYRVIGMRSIEVNAENATALFNTLNCKGKVPEKSRYKVGDQVRISLQ